MSEELNLEIPNDLQNELDELFPESVQRREIAAILMVWPRKPTTREAEKIGKAVERSIATVNDVVRILIEKGYFSKELGSMPLYRYNNQKAGLSLIGPQVKQTIQTDELTDPKDLENEEDSNNSNSDDKKKQGVFRCISRFTSRDFRSFYSPTEGNRDGKENNEHWIRRVERVNNKN